MTSKDLIGLGLTIETNWPKARVCSMEIDLTFDTIVNSSTVWKAVVKIDTIDSKELWLIDGRWVTAAEIERW